MFETKFSRHARKIFYLSACVGIAALTLWFGANINVSLANPGLNPAVKNDFDGDRTADFVIVRNLAALSSGSNVKMNNDVTAKRGARFKNIASPNLSPNDAGIGLQWAISNSEDGSATFKNFGQSTTTDFFVPSDYDGDGKADIAIWRAVAESGPGGAFFYVLNSLDNTITSTDFGVQDDNPTVVGDYDGDGKADPAVYRCVFPSTEGQCYYFFKGSLNNPNGNITYVPWGNNADFDVFPNSGDFDGDGKFDFCVQLPRPGVPAQAQFVLLKSFDGGVEYINWGTSNAAIVPGDYDNDGKNDFMVVNNINNNLRWSLLTRTGNQSYTQWGLAFPQNGPFSEFIAQSDYDGDGKTDIAVYRRDNNNSDNCYFYILRSRDGSFQAFEWGGSTDVPVNGWDVN